MQCANLLRKRSVDQPWSCRAAKRQCLEAELHTRTYPMETSPSLRVMTQQEDQQVGVVRPRAPPLCCPRCLSGESGHINHIMGH